MSKIDSQAHYILWSMARILCFIAIFIATAACEEEAPPMQRGGGGPPAAEKPEPATTPGEVPKKTAAAEQKEAPEDKSAEGAPEAAEKTPAELPPRVPTASEILGMARNENQKQSADRLPTFLADGRSIQSPRLFQGEEPTPTGAYAEMGREGMLEISPLERHWGGNMHLTKDAERKRLLTNSVAAPQEEDSIALFGPAAALETKEEAASSLGKTSSANDERKFKLTMYRLNEKTVKVNTVTRMYATEAAMNAAKRFLQKEGYSDSPPAPKALQALRDANAQKKQAAAKKNQNTCAFRATWTDGGVTNSRCFQSAADLAAFQESLQKKRQNKAAAGAAAKSKTNDGTLRQNPIQPVKLN